MPEEKDALGSLRFGRFELTADTGELRKEGVRLKLSGQAIQVLTMLTASPGKLVTREDLQQKLWPGASYGDPEHGLNAAINKLRETLGDSASEPKYIETVPGRGYRFINPVERDDAVTTSVTALPTEATPRTYKKWVFVGGVAVVVVLSLFLWWVKHISISARDPVSRTAIAVLPFQSEGSDPDTDFLRSALPQEIATALSYVPSFTISPSYMRFKYNYPRAYLQQAGRALGVTTIVTGHYVTEADQLNITLEAVDVGSNRTVWSDTIRTATSDHIALREQITSTLRQGLVPALGGPSVFVEAATRPHSEEAYDLYLRSLAVYHLDPVSNKQAILMLERSVSMDPGYAPAWEELGLRYLLDSDMGNGGEPMFKRSDSALARAVALDPNLISAAYTLVGNRTDRGDTLDAYAEASALVKRRPESPKAHFALAYVLRYVGLLDKAAHECDTALALDPGNNSLRSCAWIYLNLGQPRKAIVFVELDQGSEWAAYLTPFVLLEQGRLQEARDAAGKMSSKPMFGRDLLQACLDPAQASSLATISSRFEAAALAERDPEHRYFFGRLFAYCGQKEASFRVLKSAIEQNYCANTALLMDPFLANLRVDPDFKGLLVASKDCQDRFLQNKSVSEVGEH